MKHAHRFVVTAISALIVGALTSSAALAAGFLGPGHSSTDFADASAQWFPDANSPYVVQVSVSRSMFVFKPTHNSGGTFVVQHATVLQVQLKGPAAAGFGCFMIPDSDFMVSNGVQSASLNATVTAADFCPGFAEPLPGVGTGKPGGGPPPGGGIDLPLTVAISWSGNGATTVSTDENHTRCADFSMQNHISDSSARATATGSLTMPSVTVTPSPTQQANVDQGTIVSDTKGSPSPLCFGA